MRTGLPCDQGYDAFALVMFTCKAFPADRAVSFTRDFFAMTELDFQQF